MPQAHALIAECRRSLRSAAPLIAAQLIQVSHALVDTMVAARLGVSEFAAVGLSGSWLSLVVGLLACFVLFALAASFHLWALDQALAPLMRQHAFAACWGLFPLAAVIACRNICEATQLTRVVFIVTLIGLIINLLGNLGLGLGWFGLPALGLTGIGISTTLVQFTMLLVILICLRGKAFQRYKLFNHDSNGYDQYPCRSSTYTGNFRDIVLLYVSARFVICVDSKSRSNLRTAQPTETENSHYHSL